MTDAEHRDQYEPTPGQRDLLLTLYLDRAGEWRWTLQAANGRVVADSGEGYQDYGDAFDGARLALGVDESVQEPGALDAAYRWPRLDGSVVHGRHVRDRQNRAH